MAVADPQVHPDAAYDPCYDIPPPTETVRERRWRLARRYVGLGYLGVLLAYLLVLGFPTDRLALVALSIAGLCTQCLGRGWRGYGRMLLDWIPFSAALFAYDFTRGFAYRMGIKTHITAPADADEWLTHGVLPTVWLQRRFMHYGDPQWWDAVGTLVYTSHFIVTPVVAVALWIRDRNAWKSFITRILLLSFAGLATYILYPAAPPWFAARDGLIPPVIRGTSAGWLELHLKSAGDLLTSAQGGANLVAAMPSLHTATATVVALFFIPRVRWCWRIPLTVYPLLMGISLVYFGEHYVVDLLFGYLYGIAVTAACVLLPRWWRRAHPVAEDQTAATQLT